MLEMVCQCLVAHCNIFHGHVTQTRNKEFLGEIYPEDNTDASKGRFGR